MYWKRGISFIHTVYIKTFRKKIGFCMWMKITMTAIIERQRARLYTQKAKKCQTFLYTKSQILFKMLDNFRYGFIYKKPYTWRYGIFMKFLKLAFIYIQKAWQFALHDVYIYKKHDTSQKPRQFAIRFYIQKSGTFALRDFSLNFWNLRRGGDIYW